MVWEDSGVEYVDSGAKGILRISEARCDFRRRSKQFLYLWSVVEVFHCTGQKAKGESRASTQADAKGEVVLRFSYLGRRSELYIMNEV